MSIQIITGFSLNSIEPIDTRIVASGSTGRDAIPYKYQGLRVFDLSNNRPYVYVGATWSIEVSDQVLGTTGSIAKFASSNTVGNSNIYQVGTNIGIDTSNPLGSVQFGPSTVPFAGYSLPLVMHKAGAISGAYVSSTILGHNWYYSGSDQYFNSSVGSSTLMFGGGGDFIIKNRAGAAPSLVSSLYISPSGKVGIGTGFSISSQPSQSLSVTGTVSATGFVGGGAGLTNISPSSISNQILISAGSSLTASNVIISPTTTNAIHYLTFVSPGAWGLTTAATNIKANTAGISYNPSTNALSTGILNISGQTLNALGTSASPAISFTGDSNTGIYSPGGNILSISTGGGERFRVSAGAASDFAFKSLDGVNQLGLSVYNGGYTTLNLSPSAATTLDINGYVGINLFGTLNAKKLTAIDNSTGSGQDTSVFSNTNTGFASSTIFLATSRVSGPSCFYLYGNANSINTFRVSNNGTVLNSTGTYGSTSDIKLKENIVDATPKLEKLMQVRVVNYNFKENSGYETFKQIGVIAQELVNIFPGLVDETPDRDEKGEILETKTKSVKYSIFVPMLIKAIQEQQVQIEELKSQVASLINK